MSEIEQDRREFEADADQYGFDLTRTRVGLEFGAEPWCDYQDEATGNRWGGWLAAREKSRSEIASLKAKVQELAMQALSDSGQAVENLVDAKRYRWLRDALDNEEVTASLHEAFQQGSEALDAAIDAALTSAASGSMRSAQAECTKTVSGSGRATTGEGEG